MKPLLAAIVLVTVPLICFSAFPIFGAPLAVFFSVILLWCGELLPLPATALLVPVLISLYGVLPAHEAFLPFGSDIIFLFLGCFFLTRAMQKHGWDKRIAYFVLSRNFSSRSPSHLVLVFTVCTFTLGMWVSNTATTAIMLAIGLGAIAVLRERFSSEEVSRRFALRVLLTCAFAASISGLATPVGTPPNLIVLSFLSQHGLELSFFQWMARGLPISLLIMALVFLFLEWYLPLRDEKLPHLASYFREELRGLGPLKAAELQVAAVFAAMVLLWILPGLLAFMLPHASWATALKNTFTISVVGLGGALTLFILPSRIDGVWQPNMTWQDAKEADWGTLMLFGGGLSLGRMLEESGLALFIGQHLFSDVTASLAVIVLMTLILCVLMSEFTSSTAAASIVVPVIIPAFLTTLNLPPEVVLPLVLACAFTVNLGFMLPVSTPPNALVFATGLVPLPVLMRAGVALDILGIAVVYGWALLVMLAAG